MARKSSKKAPKETAIRQVRRVNWKGFAVLGILLVFGLLMIIPARLLLNRSVRSSALDQAEVARKKGDVDLALRHLDRYLADKPDDVPALEAKAKILSEISLPWGSMIDAANTLDLLARLDPKNPDRVKTRQTLAWLYIQFSDELKKYAEFGTDPDIERQQSRYAAAASVASELLKDSEKAGTKDAVAHRLLARAYEGQISELRGKSAFSKRRSDRGAKDLDQEEKDLRLKTIQNYQAAIEIDPKDMESHARLAALYVTWMKDNQAADKVLDAMLNANVGSIPARLIRYRAFGASGRNAEAQKELDSILKMAPEDVDVRIEAATVALGRRDAAVARRQLDAIPAAKQDDLRIKILRGYMEFAEQHPDDAIDQWRRGLLLVGGSNQDLTWRLAFNLIQLGRYEQAEPLRQQYLRLAKSDKSGMAKFLDALFDVGYGRLYDAREKLEKIKDTVPPAIKADVLLSLGRCCEMMGDTDAAITAFRNAATASPASAAPRLAIARHLQKRHPDDAIAEVDRALAEAPKETNLLFEAIRLRINRLASRPAEEVKRTPDLDDLFARADKEAKNNATLLSYRAEYLAITGQLATAVDALTLAAKGDGRKAPEIWIGLAQGLDRLNRRSEALQMLDQASLPENVGDHSRLRIAKARLLGRSGKGKAARDVLSGNIENIPQGERPELAQALGELLRELGDREGARAAFVEWARLAPKIPGPALALLAMGQIDGDEKAAKLGLSALKAIGGDREPYGMAARALDMMRSDPAHPGPPPADRLYEAELLVKVLRQEVPSLRIGSLLEGMILEFRGDLAGAVKAYKAAQKDDINSPALPKLIEAYMKLKRFDQLDGLKREYNEEAQARQQPGLAGEFDRLAAAVSMKLGDKDRADYFAAKMVDGRRDNVAVRTAFAMMLDQNNKPDEAEESLKSLVREKPNEPAAWLTLIAFTALRRTPAEVERTILQARRECRTDRPDLFLGECYWQGKDVPKAKLAFKKAAEAKPNDLPTLQALVLFYDATDQGNQVEPVLRKILGLEPANSWAARMLAMRISSRPDPATWPEAWALIAPGATAFADTPEDRLIRATILARSPESRRRMEAIPAFMDLANDLPISSPLAVDTRLRLSQAMLDIGNYAGAWDTIRPLAEDFSKPNTLALILAVESLARSKRPDEAEVYLERLAQAEPKSPQISLSSSWILWARNKKAEACAKLEEACSESLNLPNAEAIAVHALERMIKFGDLDGSLRLGKAIAARWPAQSWGLAKVQVLRKDYDEALATSQVALQAGSPREALRYALAAAVPKRADTAFVDKAVALGEAAKAKAPKDYNISVFLATLHHLRDRYDKELAYYREALELSPNNVQFLNNMAWTLCEGLHKPEEAMKSIQEAIRREGEAPQYLDTRGVIEERLGHFDRAIADLEKSVQASPSAETYFHLARAYMKAKDIAASRRCRDLAVKAKFDPEALDPTDRADLSEVMAIP